jgi:hypothetical protein
MQFLVFLIPIFSFSSAIEFNCNFTIRSDTLLPSTYACVVTTVNLEGNETLTAVHGTHLENKTNADVRHIEGSFKRNLTFIPKGMENFFPNISALRFSYCNISRVNSDDLNAFDQLEWFAMEGNPIEHIPRNFFAENSKIRVVFLNSNKIKHVGTGLLDSLQDLNHASFAANTCINKWATSANQMPELIEVLRTNCTDIEEETTTTSTTTLATTTIPSTTVEAPLCGDLNEVVCNLQEQNQILMENNEKMTEKLEALAEENTEIRKILAEIMQGIVELSSRPCGVL